MLADALAADRLGIELQWESPAVGQAFLTALDLRGLDSLFAIAVVFGIYSLHRLLAVREVGVIEEGEAAAELYGEMRRAVRHVSNVAGLRRLTSFPYALLRRRPPAADAGPEPPEG